VPWIALILTYIGLAAAIDSFFWGDGPRGNPFARMAGAGGPPRKDIDTMEYYNTLGVPKSATASDIKKAYRRMAIQKHPDKGGDPEEFKKLQEAYEVLSDDDKRRVYDQFGKEGLEGNMGAGAGGMGGQGGMGGMAEDIFSAFFGGTPRRPHKGRDYHFTITVTLEEMYTGSTKRMRVSMPGGLTGQQVRSQKNVEVPLPKGVREGEAVVLAGEFDSGISGLPPGDGIFVIRQVPHPRFERSGDDLILDMKISLIEALTGFQRPVKHLDGRIIWVTTRAGEVTKSGHIAMVSDAGMPIRGHPDNKMGRLYVRFTVEFPEKLFLTPEQEQVLRSLLPPELPLPFGTPPSRRRRGNKAAAAGGDGGDDEEEEDQPAGGGGGHGSSSRREREREGGGGGKREEVVYLEQAEDSTGFDPGGQQRPHDQQHPGRQRSRFSPYMEDPMGGDFMGMGGQNIQCHQM